MRSLLVLFLAFALTLAEEAPSRAIGGSSSNDPQRHFVGGILGNIFGNSGQCSSYRCQYDSYLAQYCCNNNYASTCCQYSNNNNVGGSGYFPGNNGGFGGSKPGTCPFNNGGSGRPPYNSGGYNRCNNDYDCPGSKKCCQGVGYSSCTYPTFGYGK